MDQPIMSNRIVRHNGIPEHPRFCECLDCRAAWEDWHEAKYAQRLLDALDTELRHAKPATDEQWEAFKNAEWPRVTAGAK